MALTRRSVQRMSGSIWPGFVDAMTALLLVLFFVLTIFMIVQFVLRETITGQEDALEQLNAEINVLARALGLSQQTNSALEEDLTTVRDENAEQNALIDSLNAQVALQTGQLADQASRIASFEEQVAGLLAERDAAIAQGTELAANIEDLEAAQARLISEQEALQLALAQARDEIDVQVEAARLAAARREALEALTADLQSQIDAGNASLTDALARLDASQANTETLAAQVDDLETRLSDEEAARLAELAAAEALRARLADTQTALTEEETARLAEAAAAEALRERLENADAELTAMTLALEEQRKRAEETLTLLAAAQAIEGDLEARLAFALLAEEQAQLRAEGLAEQAAELGSERDALLDQMKIAERRASTSDARLRQQLEEALAARLAAEDRVADQLSEADRQAILLATANQALADEEAISAASQRQVAALNEQVAALRAQLGSLQALLDEAADRDAAAQVRIESLGADLNTALARAAAEQRRRAELEEAERLRAEAEAERLRIEAERLGDEAVELERYRSDFFGAVREVIEGREGVRIVGDRFVFSSEVLFEQGSADLSVAGQQQIAGIVSILRDVSDDIPSGIDWILRVDGHTDNVPISGGTYADNWELSQARALSVVRFMTGALGFPPERLAATGFGEYRPVNPADTDAARAQNRRIEFKLTER
ncbi:MAG: peptidoglycan -binding protein [Rhodobacteraceae bacterium]|nr:peptidoglycan -binding protein [Paracoccaceae bacterium]